MQGAQPSWEHRHAGHSECWAFDFWSDDGSLAGFTALTFLPEAGLGWYWAALVGDGRPYLLVRELDVALPRSPGSRQIRAEGLWADMTCESPFEHWSFALEAFGVAMDDPDQALAGERGQPMALGLDLEWEAAAGIAGGGKGAYEQPGQVHGEILVGGSDVEKLDFAGFGWRRHAWGEVDWFEPRSWFGGCLDDGTPYRSAAGPPDIEDLEVLHSAPLLLEAGPRCIPLKRLFGRFTGPGGRGLGWAELVPP